MDPEDFEEFVQILTELTPTELRAMLAVIGNELQSRRDQVGCIVAITCAAHETGMLEDLHAMVHVYDRDHNVQETFGKKIDHVLKTRKPDAGDIPLN